MWVRVPPSGPSFKKLKWKWVKNMKLMDFSRALDLVKYGKKVSRKGWNGRGMYVVYQKAYPDGVAVNVQTAQAIGIPVGTVRNFRPYLTMCTKQQDFVPWVASQTDLLAEDWFVVE